MGIERPQVKPEGAPLERPSLTEDADFRQQEPELYRASDDLIGAMREGMVPADVQQRLFEAMNPATQRDLIARASGLDASVLATFKQQLSLVDNILRNIFADDGTIKGDVEDLGISPKDALNLSTKLSQMMVKELPKIYNMDRIQRMENAVYQVMARHFTREQMDEFLAELDKAQSLGK